MKKTVVVNLYQVARMSHWEPSRFIFDDFDTLRREIQAAKAFGFPGTYALKYDALMEPRYRELLREALTQEDEVGAWWEITRPLCQRAGVAFRGDKGGDRYDDRVDSAYSVGYFPLERKRLVDAYMEDFYGAFGRYPGSIGSWVLDPVTLEYASRRYGVAAAAICRDQLGVDGFSLWGGYPNGVYYPSRHNEYLPAQSLENQLDIPVFRLLGPDPIYNFEAEVREGLQGVYTLEPAWLLGRDPKWIRWFFHCLTREDTLGIGYAQVGQENNYLWENIRPGLRPQLEAMAELRAEGALRVETMEASARRFRAACRLTPPVTVQASRDWDESRDLSAQWYACGWYRVGFLWEKGRLRIRDCFLYREDYSCRYLEKPLSGSASMADALPVLFPQRWEAPRPYIRLLDSQGREPEGQAEYTALDKVTAQCCLTQAGKTLARFTMTPEGIRLCGKYRLVFDRLPVFAGEKNREIRMEYQGFSYRLFVIQGKIIQAGKDGVILEPETGEIFLKLGQPQTAEQIFCRDYAPIPRIPRKGNGAIVQEGKPERSPWPRFTQKEMTLTGPDSLDPRPVFHGNGLSDLLQEIRGSLDYLDGHWRGTAGELDIRCTLTRRTPVAAIGLGCLSHHRSGVVYPKALSLYVGEDTEHLKFFAELEIPSQPGTREIEKKDFLIQVHQEIGAFRLVTHRWGKMPQWCFYRGAETVFTMADNLLVVPESHSVGRAADF